MQNLPTQESIDSTDLPRGFSGKRLEFIPLLTDLPPLDELLRRHHVPRRGLVHLDCASDLNVEPLLLGVFSQALQRGEKAVLIEVKPDAGSSTTDTLDGEAATTDSSSADPSEDADSSEGQGDGEDTDFSSFCAPDLPQLTSLLCELLHEPQRPGLIVVSGIELLFHPDTLSLEKPPFPVQGIIDNWHREVLNREGLSGQGTSPLDRDVPSEEELRSRLSRVYLCQWLAAHATVLRLMMTSLWLVPSMGTPSLADSAAQTTSKLKAKTAPTSKSGAKDSSTVAYYHSLRSLLDTYCDYTLRWGSLTRSFDLTLRREVLSFPLSLLNFSLLLGEVNLPLPPAPDVTSNGQELSGTQELPATFEQAHTSSFRA